VFIVYIYIYTIVRQQFFKCSSVKNRHNKTLSLTKNIYVYIIAKNIIRHAAEFFFTLARLDLSIFGRNNTRRRCNLATSCIFIPSPRRIFIYTYCIQYYVPRYYSEVAFDAIVQRFVGIS